MDVPEVQVLRLETSASAARAVKATSELTDGRIHTSLSQNEGTGRRHRRHIADHAHHLAESGMTDVVPSPDGSCERTRSGHGPERTLRPSPLDYGNNPSRSVEAASRPGSGGQD